MAINRADLINQLAASMGAGEYAPTKYVDSRYNSETGTLYCNSKLSKSISEMAIRHFTQMKNRCKGDSLETRQMADIYQCAIEAITMMQNPAVKSLLESRDTSYTAS